MEPATKQDLDRAIESAERRLEKKLDELKAWMLDREVTAIRWFVGTQLVYVVILVGAMYFIAGHVAPVQPSPPLIIQLPAQAPAK
jgi:hypothetical protein